MTGSLHRAAPIRFLIGVVIVWTVGRGVVLAGWQPDEPAPTEPVAPRPSKRIRMATSRQAAAPALIREPSVPPFRDGKAAKVAAFHGAGDAVPPVRSTARTFVLNPPLSASIVRKPASPPPRELTGETAAAITLPPPVAHASRWSGSAWALARDGGKASPLAPGGQIGGGQAGARLLFHLDDSGRFSLSGRFSRTVGGPRQTEAAAGLDWQPARTIPLHLTFERRVALDRGGRNAWTAGAAGGVYAVPVAKGWRLDAYAEAGVVGTRRRDLYADGAARIARSLDLGHGRSLALGGGAWGAAQPGATRLDLGPSAVLRLPVAQRAIALALDWRQRVAGAARPGSGPALTLASDF